MNTLNMSNKDVKRRSQDLLARLKEALPAEKELVNEISHLVVDLRKAAADARPGTAPPSSTSEVAQLRRQNEESSKAKLDAERRLIEWQKESEARYRAELDQAKADMRAEFEREEENHHSVIDRVNLLDRGVRLFALQPVEVSRAEVAQTLLRFVDSLDSSQPQDEHDLSTGHVILWSFDEERFLGLVVNRSDYHRLHEAERLTKKLARRYYAA
jgi:hypothetical protein